MSNNLKWDDQTRLRYDPCARAQYDKESKASVNFVTDTAGFRWCESPNNYANTVREITHYPKVYRNGCQAGIETTLSHAPLTNMKHKHQLLHRPYHGAYMGAGQSTASNKDTETELIYGLDTRGGPRRACDVLSGVSIDRFQCLPEYGNPQRVEHIVPTWIRGGDNTRDYVRRINYEANVINKKNNEIINRQKKL